MIRRGKLAIALLLTALVAAACSSTGPSETPAAEPLEETSPTSSPTASPTPSPAASPTPIPSIEVAECAPGVVEFDVEAPAGTYGVRIFVPDGASSASPVPAVFNWHGLGASGPQHAMYSGYEALADQEGFVAVHATGLPVPDQHENSWEMLQIDFPDRDDVAFTEALLDLLIADYCVDAGRIYSVGVSNGGILTSILLCDLADRFAAAVAVIGTTHPDGCTPSRGVPFVAIHGTADLIIPFEGGESLLLRGLNIDPFFEQPMPVEFAEFATDMGCDPVPTVISESELVIRYEYMACHEGVPLVFYEMVGMPHVWPEAVNGLDATTFSWEFFQQHGVVSPEE